MKILYIIRGLPGSGKSTLAEFFANLCEAASISVEHVEADMYFINREGKYFFAPGQLGDAHDWCQKRVAEAMEYGIEVVIVSNTASQNWEMESYLEMAEANGYRVQVLHCEGSFGSVHEVPAQVIEKMKKRWENYDGRYSNTKPSPV